MYKNHIPSFNIHPLYNHSSETTPPPPSTTTTNEQIQETLLKEFHEITETPLLDQAEDDLERYHIIESFFRTAEQGKEFLIPEMIEYLCLNFLHSDYYQKLVLNYVYRIFREGVFRQYYPHLIHVITENLMIPQETERVYHSIYLLNKIVEDVNTKKSKMKLKYDKENRKENQKFSFFKQIISPDIYNIVYGLYNHIIGILQINYPKHPLVSNTSDITQQIAVEEQIKKQQKINPLINIKEDYCITYGLMDYFISIYIECIRFLTNYKTTDEIFNIFFNFFITPDFFDTDFYYTNITLLSYFLYDRFRKQLDLSKVYTQYLTHPRFVEELSLIILTNPLMLQDVLRIAKVTIIINNEVIQLYHEQCFFYNILDAYKDQPVNTDVILSLHEFIMVCISSDILIDYFIFSPIHMDNLHCNSVKIRYCWALMIMESIGQNFNERLRYILNKDGEIDPDGFKEFIGLLHEEEYRTVIIDFLQHLLQTQNLINNDRIIPVDCLTALFNALRDLIQDEEIEDKQMKDVADIIYDKLEVLNSIPPDL
jgi:hypothetical protein